MATTTTRFQAPVVTDRGARVRFGRPDWDGRRSALVDGDRVGFVTPAAGLGARGGEYDASCFDVGGEYAPDDGIYRFRTAAAARQYIRVRVGGGDPGSAGERMGGRRIDGLAGGES